MINASGRSGPPQKIITLLDGHKLLLPRLAYWDNIYDYDAHLEGQATYYPHNRIDWADFMDRARGEKPTQIKPK